MFSRFNGFNAPVTGQLFFTDWTEMDLATRMSNWDRCFKVLTSYPQVCCMGCVTQGSFKL
jgi:hypothetical protein